jgi:hypothetical protein
MITKLIAAVIIIGVLYGGWSLFFYWEKVRDEKESIRKEEAAAVSGDTLAGLPYGLDQSLRNATAQGPNALKNWLKEFGHLVQDPRKAWIELDYCVMLTRNDPAEAKRIFAAVRERTGPTSPVWNRVKQLAPSYE